MPERNLRIVYGPNLLFAECVGCGSRFTSSNANPVEAERQIRTAFKEHKCVDKKKPPSRAASRKEK
jgi:hypothetical protein